MDNLLWNLRTTVPRLHSLTAASLHPHGPMARITRTTTYVESHPQPLLPKIIFPQRTCRPASSRPTVNPTCIYIVISLTLDLVLQCTHRTNLWQPAPRLPFLIRCAALHLERRDIPKLFFLPVGHQKSHGGESRCFQRKASVRLVKALLSIIPLNKSQHALEASDYVLCSSSDASVSGWWLYLCSK